MNDKEKLAQVQAAAQLLIEQLSAGGMEIPEAVKSLTEVAPIEQADNDTSVVVSENDAEAETEKSTETQEQLSQDASLETQKFSSTAEFLKHKNCPFEFDEATETFKMSYSMRVCGASAVQPGATEESAFELIKAAFGSKAGSGPDFEPTEEEYQKILTFTGKSYPKEAFKVYYVTAATNEVDRHSEHFTTKALESMARLAIDQPFIKDHNRYNSDGVVGKIFDAKVANARESTGKRLLLKVYMHKTPEKQSLFDGIESGENNKVSISARFRLKDFVCDVCSKAVYDFRRSDPCVHYPGQEIENGFATARYNDIFDFMECSRVTTPAQKPAAIKSFDPALGLVKSAEQVELAKSAKQAEELAAQLADLSQTDSTETTSKSASQEITTIPNEVQQISEEDAVNEELIKALTASKEANESFCKSIADFSELVKSNIAAAESLKEVAEKLAINIDEANKAHAEKEELFEKRVEETRQLIGTTLGLHKHLAETSLAMAGQSMQDLAKQVMQSIDLTKEKAAIAANPAETQSDKDAKLKAAEGGDFYKTSIQRLSK
jgi:hypothetical protein